MDVVTATPIPSLGAAPLPVIVSLPAILAAVSGVFAVAQIGQPTVKLANAVRDGGGVLGDARATVARAASTV